MGVVALRGEKRWDQTVHLLVASSSFNGEGEGLKSMDFIHRASNVHTL